MYRVNSPIVSVVITSFNQINQLIRAVDSVLNQSYKNIQIIITDDHSTDGSQDLILDYHKKYPEKIKVLLHKKNQGIPKNKNAGFKAADGDLITYLDGDDYYFPDKIEKEVKVFNEKPDLDIVYSNFSYQSFNGDRIEQWGDDDWLPITGNVFPDVYARNFPRSTLYRCELIKKEVLKSINYYDETIKAFHDWDSRIRMTKNRNVGYSNYIGSAYVDDPSGISKQEKRVSLIKEMRWVYKKNIHLIQDLPREEKIKVIKLGKELSLKEISLQSRNGKISQSLIHIVHFPEDFKKIIRLLVNQIRRARQ